MGYFPFAILTQTMILRAEYISYSGLILGFRQANEIRRYINDISHWLGTSLESALLLHCIAL